MAIDFYLNATRTSFFGHRTYATQFHDRPKKELYFALIDSLDAGIGEVLLQHPIILGIQFLCHRHLIQIERVAATWKMAIYFPAQLQY